MVSDYSVSGLFRLYGSLCDVSDNLRSAQCSGCGKRHEDVVCKCAYFCNALSTFKAEILEELLDEFSKKLYDL